MFFFAGTCKLIDQTLDDGMFIAIWLNMSGKPITLFAHH
jgi:hypothetical protein